MFHFCYRESVIFCVYYGTRKFNSVVVVRRPESGFEVSFGADFVGYDLTKVWSVNNVDL